jgi:hypothetical protein
VPFTSCPAGYAIPEHLAVHVPQGGVERFAYPTYEQLSYDRLDVATSRDRAGRITCYTDNAARQLNATQDPAGRVIQQQFCPCGALAALIDANGHVTPAPFPAAALLSLTSCD